MTITDEIKQICAEIAEKIPQISGGGGTPSLAQIIKRTDLRNWYQHIINHYSYDYDENYEETLNAELMESIEYPPYTQDITDFSNFANGSIYHPMAMQLYDLGVRVKKFSGTLDTSNGTNFYRMFWLCADTEDVGELSDTSNGTNFEGMFNGCSALKSVPSLDLRNATTATSMFESCLALTSIPPLDLSNLTIALYMFYNCRKLKSVQLLNTNKCWNMMYMFSSCLEMESISSLDFRNVTNANSMFSSCNALTNLDIKNIKVNLQIGSGSSWGHLLTVDSLVNTIYECRDTGSTKTLTVGSANLAKLANVYVKLIDITDEMRAEDDLIDEKKPFEVCESTDEGAMLITNYVGLKNWKLA